MPPHDDGPRAGTRRRDMVNTRRDEMYHAVFEASRDAVFLLEDQRFVDCNSAAVDMFEAMEKQAVLDSKPSDFSPLSQPDGRSSEQLARARIDEALERGSAFFEWTHRTLKGRTFLSEVLLSRVDTADGVLIQGVVRDISERRETEQALRRSNEALEHFRTLVVDAIDHAEIGLFILDAQFRIVWCSQSIDKFMGLAPERVMESDMRILVEEGIRPLFEDGNRFVKNARMAYESGSRLEGRIYHVLPARGLTERWLEHQSYPISTGVYAGGRIEIYRDLSKRIALEHELSHRATHDYLTGLLNRQQLENLLDKEIRRSQRYGTSLSLIMFDIDRFKHVNDTLGHGAGDEVLKKLAAAPRESIRASDSLSRWGGEEFMLLLPECDVDNAQRMAEKLRRKVRVTTFHQELDHITVSLGVTGYRVGETRRELLKRVDDALYTAKQKGRNRVVVFE